MKATPVAFLLFLSLFLSSVKSFNDSSPSSQSNQTTPPTASTLNIYMIPHTHNDLGYLKTVDQYYLGSERRIANQGVQYILDTIFPTLKIDPSKRFIYAEIGFFEKWWSEQGTTMKALVAQILKSGQFEFVNGGYCMNDEATVYYEDAIDQMTLGHQFLLHNFGIIPEVGWHIDTFGHASAQAALFAQMGFNGLFIARVDYQDKSQRQKDKNMEMVWIPETSQGKENAMFSHVNYFHYLNPTGFNFDVTALDPSIQDDPCLQNYDLPQRADSYAAWFKQMQNSYKTSNLLHTAGGDFHYIHPPINFKNLDKLFQYINNKQSYNLNISYTLPSDYLKASFSQGVTYPTKTDDFFPYADVEGAYWTGFYTSRTALKGLVRSSGRQLQAIKRLATQVAWEKSSSFMQKNWNHIDSAIYQFEEAMAIAQHHHAVTGVSRAGVTNDYKFRLAHGAEVAKQKFVYPYFQEKIKADLGVADVKLSTCQLNTSATFCDVTYSNLKNSKPVLVAIYNSGVLRASTIRIKVPNGNVQVKDHNGKEILTDVICSNSTDSADCDLFFFSLFNSYSINYFYLTSTTKSNLVTPQAFKENQIYTINENQTITVVNMNTFKLNICLEPAQKQCYQTQFSINYNYYQASQAKDQASGAYIFKPTEKTKSSPLSYSTPQSMSIYQGKNLLLFHASSTNIIADIRIYNELRNGLELSTFINSISLSDAQGKEIVLSVSVPSISNGNTWYTDSMGMEMQQRVFNSRPSWKLQVSQPAAGNYYPVQSTIYIQDSTSKERLAILPDRAQGGSSLQKGQIELMIHRRLMYDDARGLDEELNELDWDHLGMRQWVTHTLLFTKLGFLETSYRDVQIKNDLENLVLLAPVSKTPFVELKENVQFLSIDPYIKLMSRPLALNKFLFRFQNMDESTTRAVSTSVFTRSGVKGAPVEMSLTYNQPKVDMIKKRINWNNLGLNNPDFAKKDYLNSDSFSLRPLEIRTFVISFNSNKDEEKEEIISVEEKKISI